MDEHNPLSGPSQLAAVHPQGLMRQTAVHVHGLWGRYWIIPLLPACYAGVMFSIGCLRWEHVVISLVVVMLAFASKASKNFFVLMFPFLLTAWGDDAIRFLIPTFVTPGRILGCSMRRAELALFSVGPNETLADYFAIHHAPAFDVLAAIPYTVFWMVPLFYAVYLYYADRPRLSFYLWSLLLAQGIVWIMWLGFPAAPPWYIRAYGCSIHAGAAGNAAALLRVDHMFRIYYFQDFYSRAMTTFGALPSGHCVFPMVGLLTAWHWATWRTRPLHLFYTVSMVLASAYLDHHWLLDGLAALIVSAAAVGLTAIVFYLLCRARSGSEALAR